MGVMKVINDSEIRNNPPDWMNVVECSTYLGVSQSTLRKLVKDGSIRHSRIGNQIRINKAWAAAYLADNAKGGYVPGIGRHLGYDKEGK